MVGVVVGGGWWVVGGWWWVVAGWWWVVGGRVVGGGEKKCHEDIFLVTKTNL